MNWFSPKSQFCNSISGRAFCRECMSFECHNMDCTRSERKYEVMQKSGMGFFSYLWECLNCCHNAHFELCICLIMRSNTYVLKSF